MIGDTFIELDIELLAFNYAKSFYTSYVLEDKNLYFNEFRGSFLTFGDAKIFQTSISKFPPPIRSHVVEIPSVSL